MTTTYIRTIKDYFVFTDCRTYYNAIEDVYEVYKDGQFVATFPKRNLVSINIERRNKE